MDQEEPTLQTVKEDEDICFNTRFPEVFYSFPYCKLIPRIHHQSYQAHFSNTNQK